MKEQYRRERKLLARAIKEERLLRAWTFAALIYDHSDRNVNIDRMLKALEFNHGIKINYTDLLVFLHQVRRGVFCQTVWNNPRMISNSFRELYWFIYHRRNDGPNKDKERVISDIKKRFNDISIDNHVGALLRKAFDECEHALALLQSRSIISMMRDKNRYTVTD